MNKAPEEGKIWEWRAFGHISDKVARKVRAYPIRMGISNLRGEDIYLISPASDQNIKLRSSSAGMYLKIKLLLETRPGAFELYRESIQYNYSFPVSFEILEEAARLLKVTLPDDVSATKKFSEVEAVGALARSSPPAVRVDVKKVRSQYQFDDGWIEIGVVEFSRQRAETISIHSVNLEPIRRMIDKLEPGEELEAMNYIEACRRWGIDAIGYENHDSKSDA